MSDSMRGPRFYRDPFLQQADFRVDLSHDEDENSMRIDDDKLRIGKSHALRRRMLQKWRSSLGKGNCFSNCRSARL